MMRKVIDLEKTGLHIKELCDNAGIKVSDIQKELMLNSHQSIYRWFWGQTLPSVENLYILAHMLKMPIEGLLIMKDETVSDERIIDIIRWLSDKVQASEELNKQLKKTHL